MLTVKTFTSYGNGFFSALVEQYRREYSVICDERGVTTHRTNGNQYERLASWKVRSDLSAISDFADWATDQEIN